MTETYYEDSPICPMCSGAYVTVVSKQKCNCDVCIEDTRKETKVDGRKTVTSSGVFPYRLRESARQQVINSFLEKGECNHSGLGFTLGAIIEHCVKYKISFKLIAYPNAFYSIERIKNGNS